MNDATTKAVIAASLFIGVGLLTAVLVSGEWLIAVGTIAGWAFGVWLIRSVS